MRILLSMAAMFGAATLVGCTSGTTTGTGRTTAGAVEYEIYPTEVIVLKAGESKDVKVSRKGGDAKDMDLSITSSDPKVKVEGGKFKGDAKEATVTVKADPDAPAKEHTLTIKAGDVTKTVRVRVDAAGGGTDTGANTRTDTDKAGTTDAPRTGATRRTDGTRGTSK